MTARARRSLASIATALVTGLLVQLAASCDESSLRADIHDSDLEKRPPICGVAPDEVVLMDACGLGGPCPVAHFYGRQNACGGPLEGDAAEYDAAEYCVLEHLASGAPGRLALRWECEGHAEDAAIYVLGPGDAMLVTRVTTPCEGSCVCDEEHRYRALERCALREPEYFAACLEASASGERVECMELENWFTGCGADAPTCIP